MNKSEIWEVLVSLSVNEISLGDAHSRMCYFVKEYAELKCKEQRLMVAKELVTWTEDLSLPNQKEIHEICMNVETPEIK